MTHMGNRRGACKVLVPIPGERDHLKDLGVDGRIILKCIFKKWDGRHGLDCSGSGEGQVAGACECCNELSGSIKCGEFLDSLWTC
jgi:hypothetical protein